MADISPPRVVEPIYHGAEVVGVWGVAGYDVSVYADYQPGAAPVGRGRADRFGWAVVRLERVLNANEKVTATQGTEGRTSEQSWKAVTVEEVPQGILINRRFPPPTVGTPLYQCQYGFWVKEVVPGVQITSRLSGIVDPVKAQTPWQQGWVWVNAPGIGLPQDVTAAQGFPSQAIPLPSLDSAPPESAKPAPVFNDNKDFQVVIVADKSTNPPTATVSAGAKVIEVCNTLAGARIRIYADDGSGGQIEYGVRVAFGGCRRIDLDRAIEADHPPLAEQWLCDGTPKSPPSTPVKIAQAVRDPKVEQPICAESRTVTVLGTEPGAYVELQVKASGQPTFEGRGGTTAKGPVTDIDASVTLKDGDEVRVRQLHDGQPPSGWASAPVGGPPRPLAVEVRNDHNPGVLRFYRGQTVRFRAVRCGAREAAGTVRMTPPAGSGKPQFMLPLQETKPGYVEAAWHIPLHANDAPAGEYAAQFVIPAENPPAIAFSIGFSAEDIAAILAAHNQCRAAVKEVQLPPLAWSDDLAAEAQAWANHLASDVGKLVHHDGGENLLMWWPIGSRKPADAVEEDWCDDVKGEKSKFIPPCAAFGDDCSTTKKWDDIGHYTQVMWGQTRHVGGGLAQDPVMGCEFLVLRYDPPGNVRGKPVFAV